MKTVTFDFDGTLSRPDVQEYFKELIGKGIDCWVVTSRYDDLHKHLYQGNPTNEDLWEVIDRLGLPRHKVRFCNMVNKYHYLSNTDVIWHLDDDEIETYYLNNYAKITGIYINYSAWKQLCNCFLGIC